MSVEQRSSTLSAASLGWQSSCWQSGSLRAAEAAETVACKGISL